MSAIRKTIITMLLSYCSLLTHASAEILPGVVPAVQSWTPASGTLDISGAKVSSKIVGDGKKIDDFLENEVTSEIKRFTKPSANPASIVLTNEGADAARPEGYILEVTDKVTIRSSSYAGLVFGTRTLLQLAHKNPLIPQGVVKDWPTYTNRMLMLDVGRKPTPLPVLKDYIRMMSWYKMNELHVHFSDEAFGGSYAAFRIESDTFPGLAAKDFSYSKKDIRELQDFAKAYGVTITPEFDMPGHARCFTNYWPDTMLKGYPNYVDVTNPKTIENLKKLLDEMIPLFDCPDIHIGTDEYRVGDRPDLHEAFRKFINTMNAHVRSHGKNCRIWSGFEHMKGTTEIDPTVIIDMWETDDAKGQIAKGHKIINSNHGRTYIVPGCKYYGISRQGIYQGWEPFMVSGDATKNPTKDDPNLLGGKLHVWSDQGPSGYTQQEIATLTLPGIQAFAEKLWGTKGSENYDEFVKRAALTLPVPGISVLERIHPTQKEGVILDLPAEQKLTSADSTIDLPLAKAERADLEYPWTLTFEVRPSKEAGANRGVIFSSDLAEICAGSAAGSTKEIVTEFADGTKRRGSVNTAGLGAARLAGAPLGKDPFSGYLSHDVSKFSGKTLPAEQWSTVTVVGTEGRHTFYLNGVKIFEVNNQMLCPLRWIGSKSGNSFIGSVRNLRVLDYALSVKEIGRAAGLDLPDNLAAHAKVTATRSDAGNGFIPEKITDENPSTRWSSGATRDEVTVTIELAKTETINGVIIDWENAAAGTFIIQTTEDGKQWIESFKGEAKASARSSITFPETKASQLRIIMTNPVSPWGYSIFNIEAVRYKSPK